VQHIPNRSPDCLPLKAEDDIEMLLVRGVPVSFSKVGGEFVRQKVRCSVGRQRRKPLQLLPKLSVPHGPLDHVPQSPRRPTSFSSKAAVVPRSCLLKTTSLPGATHSCNPTTTTLPAASTKPKKCVPFHPPGRFFSAISFRTSTKSPSSASQS
jgi:hypothetical protein